MYKKINLSLSLVLFTVISYSQVNNPKSSSLNKDLYQYHLKDSVKSVRYSRIVYREDLDMEARQALHSDAFSYRDAYHVLHFNTYGMSLDEALAGDTIQYDEKDLQIKAGYTVKKQLPYPAYKNNLLKANTVTWNISQCYVNNALSGTVQLSYKYLFDKNGNITAEKQYFPLGDRDTITTKYDEKDLYETTKYIYDVKGNLIQQRLFSKEEDPSYYTYKDGAYEIWNYEYDAKNRLIRTTKSQGGEPMFEEKYKYHPTENYIAEKYVFEENGLGFSLYENFKTVNLFYNKLGDVMESDYFKKSDYDNSVTTKKIFYEYEFDAHNNWVSCKLRFDSKNNEVTASVKRSILYYEK
ncbi:hypothetical protein [Flavobacterium sp. CLA17]|uniref:hypothetical protein n=1 Tax=Flavobacterium sp. CLA17 TaxID=2724135 RepID=UPI00196769A1|nr:hypothetical protein [Flavobacterium sp. CLA17]QSB28626.1 hypothetical protein HAV12_007805 [Flavobacterium sp. CLA17]